MDIQILFQDHAGPDVKYVAHEKKGRELVIRYQIPSLDGERLFFIRGLPRNGLNAALRDVVLRAADAARRHAYRATGQFDADLKQLLQGKLVDEYSRGTSPSAAIGATAAVDPES